MSTIVTRSGKGSPLTNNEIDANFNNLNTDKIEDSDLSVTTNSAGTAALAYTSGVFTYTPPNLSGFAALSGAAFTGAITTNSTFDGRDVATDGSKLDGIVGSIYGSSSAPVVFAVTVGSKTAGHPYNGDGSGSAYFLNGVESPAIQFSGADNVTSASGYYYKFDQADGSNSGHPLLFYYDAAKTTAFTTGVTTSGTAGSSGAHTTIAVTADTPNILYYECSAHAYMGNVATAITTTIGTTAALKVPSGTTAQRPTGVAGQFRYNATDGAFEGYTTEWGEIGGGAADLLLNSFTGDGSDVTFSLSGAAIENNTLVYVDGVYQNKATYAVSAATPAVVTFSEAPANGSAIEIMVAAIAVTNVGTPSDNTVTTAKIVNNAVTTAKIADANVTTAKIADGSITSAKLGAGVGGAFNDFAIKTTAYTAVTRDQLIVNSSSAVTITLPASPAAGNVVFIKNAGTGTVTVGRNGSKINSTTDDGSLAADAGATLVFVNATIGWKEL